MDNIQTEPDKHNSEMGKIQKTELDEHNSDMNNIKLNLTNVSLTLATHELNSWTIRTT